MVDVCVLVFVNSGIVRFLSPVSASVPGRYSSQMLKERSHLSHVMSGFNLNHAVSRELCRRCSEEVLSWYCDAMMLSFQ